VLDKTEQGIADEIEIRDLLDILAELDEQRAAVAAPLLERIAALDEQITRATADLDAQIEAVQKAVRRAIVAHGATVETERVRAIYVKPRVTWDTQRLEGYAEAHPEIRVFRREGEPGVRIMVMGEKE